MDAIEHNILLDLDKWLLYRGSKEEFESFFMLAWGFWRRNKKLYEEVLIQPKDAIEWSLSIYSLYIDCSSALTPKLGRIRAWQPPPEGWFKVNIDVTLFFDIQEACIRATVRDNRGDIMLVASIKEKQVQEPKTIQSLAILRGLQQCLHLGITNLIIESNCQLVVSEIQSS